MNHKQMEEVTPITITLTKDGKVTGAKSGSWAMTSGTGYITLTLGGIVYRGVVVPQTVDGTDIPAIGITATTEDKNNVGVQLWAYHMKPRYAIAFTALKNAVSLKDGDIIKSNIELPAKAYFGATIKWTSSDATVINANGVYKAPSADTEVTLTCTITAENASYSHSYRVTAAAADDLPDGDYLTGCVAHYPFTSKTTPNQIDKTQRATFKALGSGTVPVTLRDAQRSSNVVHQFFGDKDLKRLKAALDKEVKFVKTEKKKSAKDMTIILRADKDAPIGFINRVIHTCQEADIETFALRATAKVK